VTLLDPGAKLTNYDVTTTNGTLTVTRAPLAIGTDGRRVYGGPTTYTSTYTGFVNGEGASVLTGTLSCTSTATDTSPSGSYPLTCGGLSSANYDITFTTGTLVIVKAATSTTVTSTAGAIVGASLTFSASVIAVAPATGTPTGTVQFKVDGIALGTPATLVGGSARSAPITTLSVGTHVVTAEYSGDAGFNTSSGTATQTVSYRICVLYDPTKAAKLGSTVPIKLQLCNASGANLSASTIVVRAVSVQLQSTDAPGVLADPSNANPDNDVRFDGSLAGYIYNLSTKALASGTWRLTFTAQDAPGSASSQTYSTTFQVK